MEKKSYQENQIVMTAANEETEEIDLVEVFYLLWGHVWQILACTIVGAAIAFAATYFLMTPQYKATASMYVVSASDNTAVNLTDLQIGTQLTTDYQELLLSRPLLQKVIDGLNLSITADDLKNRIEITKANDTRILKVTTTDPNPQVAADITNELVHQALEYLPEVMEAEAPNLVEEAIVPTHKSSPSYSKNTVLGALVGAVLACGVLLVHFLLNDTFVTPDDVAKYLNVQPLAATPEADLGSFNDEKKKNKKKGAAV